MTTSSNGGFESKLDTLEAVLDRDAEKRLYAQASKARSGAAKLIWLQRAADVVGQAVMDAGVAACADGCAHCCHIALAIGESEAVLLARVSGKTMARDPARSVVLTMDALHEDTAIQQIEADSIARFHGLPCPFLLKNRCSVYTARPLACRLQLSLADSNEPCRLHHKGAKVPYLNMTDRKAAGLAVLGFGKRLADIRDWFPTTKVTT